jgi:hypothetical protein
MVPVSGSLRARQAWCFDQGPPPDPVAGEPRCGLRQAVAFADAEEHLQHDAQLRPILGADGDQVVTTHVGRSDLIIVRAGVPGTGPDRLGALAPGQEPHPRRDASVVQQPRANGLRCDLGDEDGDAVGCGSQKSEDPADGVGGRDRLREDQPHNERDEQEPDESPHRPPPFRAGRGER